MKTTVIQKADYVLGWDEDSQRHIYMTGADVAFVDGQITYVGADFKLTTPGELETVSGSGKMLMPGLVDVDDEQGEDGENQRHHEHVPAGGRQTWAGQQEPGEVGNLSH